MLRMTHGRRTRWRKRTLSSCSLPSTATTPPLLEFLVRALGLLDRPMLTHRVWVGRATRGTSRRFLRRSLRRSRSSGATQGGPADCACSGCCASHHPGEAEKGEDGEEQGPGLQPGKSRTMQPGSGAQEGVRRKPHQSWRPPYFYSKLLNL